MENNCVILKIEHKDNFHSKYSVYKGTMPVYGGDSKTGEKILEKVVETKNLYHSVSLTRELVASLTEMSFVFIDLDGPEVYFTN
jgi:hypothetical protein